MTTLTVEALLDRVDQLNHIGVALSREDNLTVLLEDILLGAKRLTNADAGTLYLMAEDKLSLLFENVRCDKLNIELGGTTGNRITFPPVSLCKEDGTENLNNVVTYAALTEQTVNIEDAYCTTEKFDFSGTRAFDEKTGYHSKSFLTIPLKNHEKEVIGVLQLLNRLAEDNSEIITFSKTDQQLAESLASQAAVTLTNKRLIEEQKVLFEDFIQLIAKAIDEKSPYTGGHCTRVPILSMMIADAINKCEDGPLKNTQFDEDEVYELKIGSWLHDCGKVTTPEFVMDKATKLSGIFDRVDHIDLRLQIVKMQYEVDKLREQLKLHYERRDPALKALNKDIDDFYDKIDEERDFIRKVNVGGEFLEQSDKEHIEELAEKYQWSAKDIHEHPLLYELEVTNLSIGRGTLNDEERQIIANHVSVTLKMLNSLHYPKKLKNVPEIAGSHHEKMDGTGYPRKIKGEDMLLQSRIVAVADVFEALTAADRPYKKWKTLSESLRILGFMAKDGHIDPDVFDVFVREKVYLTYANEYLTKKQVDAIDETEIPGYNP